MDAYDKAEPNLVSTLYALITKYQCDLSFCGYRNTYEDGSPDAFYPVKLEGNAPRSGEELLWLRVFNKIPTPTCGTLIRSQFLQETGLRFHEGCTAGEDVEFLLKVFCRVRQAAFTPECLHIYVHHAGMGSVHENNSKEKTDPPLPGAHGRRNPGRPLCERSCALRTDKGVSRSLPPASSADPPFHALRTN